MAEAVEQTIQPDAILKELAELWVSLAKPEEAGGAGVLRACAMTLVAVIDESEDPQNVGETLASLMREHPSRAIVLRLRESMEPFLSSRVYAQCWMPFGQRRQICCEQIEITASDPSLFDLPPVILPLTVADLPVILWCRIPRLFHLPAFPMVAGVAQKVILDSAAMPDARMALRELAETLRQGRLVGDLVWTRLTRWRELVAQIFENRAYLAGLPHVTRLRIHHDDEHPSTAARYMAAWLLSGLEKAGAKAEIVWELGPSAIALESEDGACNVAMCMREGTAVEIHVNDLVHRAVFPPPTDYTLLREELSIPGRDSIFETTLARAAQLG